MDKENQLPDEFDLVVIGTGMIESIVSAAASRIGKTVLHIDRDDYYGGHWASFNLKSIENLWEINSPKKCGRENPLDLGNDKFDIKDFEIEWNVPEEDINIREKSENDKNEIVAKESEPETTEKSKKHSYSVKESLLKNARKFNIDLMPKLHYARGNFVELLISSNIARYAEYRSVSRVLTWLNGQLEVVPCSRSDVFSNNKVSVMEKRMLMKLLTSLDLDSEEMKSYESKTFQSFLKDRKLTPNLIHYVLYAISRSNNETSCLEGIQNTKRFLDSLGRFGKTPFLFSMYGSGETPQAFCRLSAVFGGIFALSQPLRGLECADNKVTHLISGNQRIKGTHFVSSIEKSPQKFVDSLKVEEYISRAVLITDRSMMPSEQEHLTLLMYPPENGKNSITMVEMGPLTGTCPKGLFLVHLIAKQQESPKTDFQHVMENLFELNFTEKTEFPETKPQILWSSHFSIPNTSETYLKNEEIPENMFLCSGPDLDLDYDQCICKAREIFSQMYPDLEFLPRAPDPEDIIIGEDAENTEDTQGESTDIENNVADLQSESKNDEENSENVARTAEDVVIQQDV